MSINRLWAFLAVALPVLAALLAPLPATDLTYHLRAGAEILDTGRIPSVDTWTFTAAGEPWLDQQWGAQVFLELVFRLGGWTGLVLLRAGLVGVIVGAVYASCRRSGVSRRRAAWLTLGAFVVAAPALALRPQLLAMALFALCLFILTARDAHPRGLWLIPLLTIPWANVHGSFFLAPAMLGLAWLGDLGKPGRERRAALAAAAASALAACITPFGPEVWAYAIGLGGNPDVTSRISEWQPTSLRDVPGIVFLGSVLLVVALLVQRGRAVPWATLAWLGFFFVLGAYAARGIAWWPFAAVAALAPLIGAQPSLELARTESTALRRLNLIVAGTLVLAGVALLPLWRPTDAGLGAPSGVLTQAPSGITAELHRIAGPDDRLFNPQPWGSWFEFALPEVPVAIDSRIELFPRDTWNAYMAVTEGRGEWEAVLEDWGVTIVVVDRDSVAFAERLEDAGWRRGLTDADGVVLVPGGGS